MTTVKCPIATAVNAAVLFYSIPASVHARLKLCQDSLSSSVALSQERVNALEEAVRRAMKAEVDVMLANKEKVPNLIAALLQPDLAARIMTTGHANVISYKAFLLACHRAEKYGTENDVRALVQEVYGPLISSMCGTLAVRRNDILNNTSAPPNVKVAPKTLPSTSGTAASATSAATPSSSSAAIPATAPQLSELEASRKSLTEFLDSVADFNFPIKACQSLETASRELRELLRGGSTGDLLEDGLETLRLGLTFLEKTYGKAIAHRIRRLLSEPEVVRALEATVLPPLQPGALAFLMWSKGDPRDFEPLHAAVEELFSGSGLINRAHSIITANEPRLLIPKIEKRNDKYDAAFLGMMQRGLGPVRVRNRK